MCITAVAIDIESCPGTLKALLHIIDLSIVIIAFVNT